MEKNFERRKGKTGFPREDFFIALCLQKYWDSVEPPEPTEIIAAFTPEVARTENEIHVLKGMSGLPRDIFIGLNLGDPSFLSSFHHKVNSFDDVELFGAAGPFSVYDVACFLNSQEYQGRLRVVDVSSFPLDATRPYIEKGNFGLRPDQFSLVNSSVLDLDPNSSADLILADVLSLYLSSDELHRLAANTTQRLRSGGLYITRDLVEPNGPPPPHKRNVSGQNKNPELQKFIEDNYGIKMSLEEIQKRQDGVWAGIDTFSRVSVDEYTAPFLEVGFDLKQSIPITSEAIYETENPRVFYVNVFEKK